MRRIPLTVGTLSDNSSMARYPFALRGLVAAYGASLPGAEYGYDLSGRGNDGTLNGGMGTITSEFDSVWDFDGLNDNVTVANSVLPLGDTDFSVVFWGKWVTFGTIKSPLAVGGDTNNGISFFTNFGTTNSIALGWWNARYMRTPTDSIATGEWIHIVATKAAGEISVTTNIYLNGVNQALTAAGTPFTPNVIEASGPRLGGGQSGFLTGQQNGVLFYDRVLSPSEAADLYDITLDNHMAWAERRLEFIGFSSEVAPPITTIPIFDHHYRMLRV